jgi:CII-binding regulator of phage lambda lysogenization HflD
MIQNNIRRAEELKKITSSVIKLRAELENVNQALQKLINKEIQEIEEEDRYWQQQADIKKESA